MKTTATETAVDRQQNGGMFFFLKMYGAFEAAAKMDSVHREKNVTMKNTGRYTTTVYENTAEALRDHSNDTATQN